MHPRYSRPAASSVHYTTSCKHSLELLGMGEIIVRNVLSWLELLINPKVAYSWSSILFLLVFLQLLYTFDMIFSYISNGHFLDVFNNNFAVGHFVNKIIYILIEWIKENLDLGSLYSIWKMKDWIRKAPYFVEGFINLYLCNKFINFKVLHF